MADQVRKIDIVVGTSYTGGGIKSATADLAKLRADLALPVMGPLNRSDQLIQNQAVQRIRAMEQAAERSNIGDIINNRLFGSGGAGNARFSVDEQARRDAQAGIARGWRARAAAGTAAGMESEFAGLRGYGNDVARLRGGGGAAGRAAEAEQQESFRAQERKLMMMARGFGTVAIADIIGRSMQKMPEAIDKFAADIKGGATKTEAFASMLADTIPGVGELSKGFRAVGQAAHYLSNMSELYEAIRKEEEQDRREAIQKRAEEYEKNVRQPQMIAARRAEFEASDMGKVSGLHGTQRENAQALADYEKSARDIDLEATKRKKLGSTEDQDEIQRQFNELKAAKYKEYQDKLADIAKASRQEYLAGERQQEDALIELDESTARERFEQQGRFYDAKMQGIMSEWAKEKRESARQREDKGACQNHRWIFTPPSAFDPKTAPTVR